MKNFYVIYLIIKLFVVLMILQSRKGYVNIRLISNVYLRNLYSQNADYGFTR